MFQTELIRFLQSFSAEWLADGMVLVTQLGYSSFYIPVLIVILFGFDFRKGFLLTQMMIWVGLITTLLKNVIALPRPADVDSAVKLIEEGIPNPTPFVAMGADGFWDLPDAEAVRIIRAQPEWSFGIPSGHVSGTATFWVGLALLFRPVVLRLAAVAMLLLMPLSRMYLGRHFLADVLGGFAVGAGMLVIAHVLFIKPGTHHRLLTLDRLQVLRNLRSATVPAFLLLAPLLFLALSPRVEAEDAGRLLGLNAAFVALALSGLSRDAASWPRRVARVVLAFAIFVTAALLVGQIVDATLNVDRLWVEFLAAAIPAFTALWGGVKAGMLLGLYSRGAEPGSVG